jgi:hypothetical protein
LETANKTTCHWIGSASVSFTFSHYKLLSNHMCYYFFLSCLPFLVLKLGVFQQVSWTKIQVLNSLFWAICPEYFNLIDFNISTMLYQLPILYIFPAVFKVLHVFKHHVFLTKFDVFWYILAFSGYGLCSF